MVFSSSLFLFVFLPICMLLYHILPQRVRNIYLFVISLLFYAWGEPKNVLWLILSMVLSYAAGLITDRMGAADRILASRVVLGVFVSAELGLLFYFKFSSAALPIGISFFVFKCLSYVIDVYMGKVSAERDPLKLGLYIAFFPQIMAGPITRYTDIGPQIEAREVTSEKLYKGATRFMIGFAKKVMLSDQLIDFVALAFSNAGYSAPTAWLGAIAYTLEIYFDFSGYSDMVIGLALMMGFETKENFDLPYIADSVQDFWRRWHISLSTWFRDYVYIPLGGSRCSKLRTCINVIIVFFLTGLWHGSSWNFIAWGLFYAVFLVIERIGFKDVLQKLPAAIRHIYALLVIVIGWVFFRAEGLSNAVRYIRNMFVINGDSVRDMLSLVDAKLIAFMVIGIILSSGATKIIRDTLSKKAWLYNACVVIVFVIAMAYMWAGGLAPFLYFKF